MLDGSLRCEQETADVDVEELVIVLFGEGLDRGELVDAGVVDEDVEAAEVLDRRVDKALGLGGVGHIGAYGDGFATAGGDGGNYSIRASLAGGIIDDDG